VLEAVQGGKHASGELAFALGLAFPAGPRAVLHGGMADGALAWAPASVRVWLSTQQAKDLVVGRVGVGGCVSWLYMVVHGFFLVIGTQNLNQNDLITLRRFLMQGLEVVLLLNLLVAENGGHLARRSRPRTSWWVALGALGRTVGLQQILRMYRRRQ
jgi:hypothetical protein